MSDVFADMEKTQKKLKSIGARLMLIGMNKSAMPVNVSNAIREALIKLEAIDNGEKVNG